MAQEIQSEFIVRNNGRMYWERGIEGREETGKKGITRDRRVVLNMYSGADCHFSRHCCYEAGGRGGGGGGGGNSCCLLYIQQQYPESTTKDAPYLRWKHVLTYTQGGVVPMQ